MIRSAAPIALAAGCVFFSESSAAAPPIEATKAEAPAADLASVPAVASPPPEPPSPRVLPPVTVVEPAPSPAPAPVTRRTVAFAAAGVALIGAGLATTFGILALKSKSAYESNPTLSNSDDGNNDAAYADGAIALTAVAGITSLILFLTDEPPSAPAAKAPVPRAATLSASPFLTPHGAGAGALLRF